ncbi:MAG TPA: hypothetical protein PLD20_14015 [Blastocatellia bacterium]|nr:hypothetical protein [Blastocatellia bacterium]HMV82560.1 hypothetical protein [Blastocatellia bacterium]HMX27483.1 hypothetical protein [Blastocatellia bacterium]HMY71342.1 hypothetical protein [Blastocatellia bacterium]HMZ19047.1 hypothetical protein [Blastocatellia bacterium]
MRLGRAFLLLVGLWGFGAVVGRAQDEDATRRFWPPNYRPASAQPMKKPATPPRYRIVSDALPKDTTSANSAALGVTVWLLSDGKDDKDGARILRPKSGIKTDYTAKRVEVATKFAEGQKLRLSLEVPRSGFLYVIDREQYADGSFSQPYLIFPISPAEDNRVSKGRVFELPQAGDEAFFAVSQLNESGKSPLVTDVLTVLVTPAPLAGLPKPIRKPDGEYDILPLPETQVAEWEKKWGGSAEVGELEGGAGRLYTTREQAAGNRKQRLDQADPLPQTVFRVAVKPRQPLLVKIPLQIAAK